MFAEQTLLLIAPCLGDYPASEPSCYLIQNQQLLEALSLTESKKPLKLVFHQSFMITEQC